jgi:hypothetical protein
MRNANFDMLGPSELPPSAEVGKWLARLIIIDSALKEKQWLTRFNAGSSMDPNYPYEYVLACNFPSSSAWREHPDYEHLQIHELSEMIPSQNGTGARAAFMRMNKLAVSESVEPLADINQQMWRIQRHARRTALQRVGIVQPDSLVLDGAIAAYMYLRGDIRDSGDRALHDRGREIEASIGELLVQASEHDPTPIPVPVGTEAQRWWQLLDDELQSFDRQTSGS